MSGVGGIPYSALGHLGVLPYSTALSAPCAPSLSSNGSLRNIPASVRPFTIALGFHNSDICTSIFRAIFHPFLFSEESILVLSACSALASQGSANFFFHYQIDCKEETVGRAVMRAGACSMDS